MIVRKGDGIGYCERLRDWICVVRLGCVSISERADRSDSDQSVLMVGYHHTTITYTPLGTHSEMDRRFTP